MRIVPGTITLRNADLPYGLGLALLVLAAYAALFNRYAFDDSYFGYAIAHNLLTGGGFAFNAGSRIISTSAPLAPPLYAALAFLFRSSIVQVAQVASALGPAIVAFGTYALVKTFAARAGAFCAAAILVSSPFTLLLWSHEMLLYVAASIVGLWAFVARKYTAAAIVLGIATLFRAETLLMLPLLWFADGAARGRRAALRFALLSLAPNAAWASYALATFGTLVSASVASKQAQLHYPTITPYLYGLLDFTNRIYAFTPGNIWLYALVTAVTGCWIVAATCGFLRPVYRWIAAWAIATTLLYVALGLPFYFWFAVQIGVILAASAALMWPTRPAARCAALATAGRAAALVLVAINLTFLALLVRNPERTAGYDDWIVMPSLQANAYASLATWFTRHAAPGDTIAYAEFGKLHYYAERDIVDILGIVSPGAVAQLRTGNPIWAFKRYRPTWFVASPTFAYFVDPLEYDWFRNAYVAVAMLQYPGFPHRNSFTIYELRRAAMTPPANERDTTALVQSFRQSRSGFAFAFRSKRAGMNEVEVRVRRPAACRRASATLRVSSARIASRDVDLTTAPDVSRITLAFPARFRAETARFELAGCLGITVAPPDLLRRGFVWLGDPETEHGRRDDALTVYVHS